VQTQKVASIVNVIEIAVAIGVVTAEAKCKPVRQWAGDCELDLVETHISGPDGAHNSIRELRRQGCHGDGPCGRVFSEQRSLRPAQYFDLADIGQIKCSHSR